MTDLTMHEQLGNSAEEANSEVGFLGQRTSPSRTRAYRDLLAWFTSEFRPPEVVAKGRPGLADTWRYLHHGGSAPPEGLARLALLVYAGLALPVRALLAYADWIVERPTRLLATWALWAVLSLTPFGRFLPHPW